MTATPQMLSLQNFALPHLEIVEVKNVVLSTATQSQLSVIDARMKRRVGDERVRRLSPNSCVGWHWSTVWRRGMLPGRTEALVPFQCFVDLTD